MTWWDDDPSGLRLKTPGDRIAIQITFLLAAVTPGYLLLIERSSGLIWRVLFAAAAIWFLLIAGVMFVRMVPTDRRRRDTRD